MANKAHRISMKDRILGAIRGWSVGYIPMLSGFRGVNGIDFGVVVDEDAALRFTAVYAAIKLLSENIASLPKSVKRRTDDGYEDAVDHAVWRTLCVAPNEYTDIFAFWFKGVADLFGRGNFFAVIDRRPDGTIHLHQVNTEWVTILVDQGLKGYRVNCPIPAFQFLNRVYLDHEMIHVMLFTRDGIIGLDPITYNAAAIGRGIATNKFSGEFYKRGGQIKGVLETDRELGDDQYKAFTEHFAEASGNFDTPLLEYGIKYKDVGISPVAAQLIQTETLSIDDIARIFNVPPHLLAELSHATFSNIEQQNIFFGEFSLRPICKRIEVQLERKLFTSREIGQYSIKFDLRGLMRGDSKARAEYYQSGINTGWMTPNEARRMEELRSLPGLDLPRMPLNSTQIDEDGKPIPVEK